MSHAYMVNILLKFFQPSTHFVYILSSDGLPYADNTTYSIAYRPSAVPTFVSGELLAIACDAHRLLQHAVPQ